MTQREVKHIVIDARGRQSSSGRYIDRLIEHLQDIDTINRYTILLKPDDTWQPRAANFTAIPCPYKAFSFNPLDQITFARFLYRLQADLVHFWMTPQEPLFYFKPHITTTHDLTMLRFVRAGRLPLPMHWLRMAAYRLLLWASHRKARRILVPTRYVERDVARLHRFAAQKITVTLEASEPPLQAQAKAPKNVVQNAKFILAVGSAFPHKNLDRLVDAHKILLKKYPDLMLYFCGKKEYYYQLLDTYIEQNTNTERVKTLGFVSDAELKWLYQNCAAYVFPSLSEGFGLPGLEAMVHGAPVVSSSATCLPEVYGDAALYFDPSSPAAIAKTIEKLLHDQKLKQELITKGYEQARKFSWRKMAEQTVDVYTSVLG